MSCCPPGSWPSLKSDHIRVGSVSCLGRGLSGYVVGSSDVGKAVIVIPDIFGIESGRTTSICDQLADAGYFVVCPDVFRGDQWVNPVVDPELLGPWLKTFPYEPVIRKEIYDITVPFITSKGISTIGLWGFCFGSWVIFKLCSDEKIAKTFKYGVVCNFNMYIDVLKSLLDLNILEFPSFHKN